MADTKISALPAATLAAIGDELAVNQGGVSKKIALDVLLDFVLKSRQGASASAGPFLTWLVLDANSGDITGTGLTAVMAITDVGVGRYHFRCHLIYQAAVATHGVDVAVNHTGTTTQFVAEIRYCGTGTTTATAAGTEISTTAAGNIYVGQGSRTKNAIIGAGVATVDTANSDMILIIEGFFVVSVTGSLEIKLAASGASLVVRAMQGSFLELKKLS